MVAEAVVRNPSPKGVSGENTGHSQKGSQNAEWRLEKSNIHAGFYNKLSPKNNRAQLPKNRATKGK
jgi:hypothetical protein